ncbi:MAG: hypothetical protein AB1716_22665, partial [Planctomycetota bacterium]
TILAWADEHKRRTGHWPIAESGEIHEAPGETWVAVDSALRSGSRSCRPGGSLARLLATHRGVRNLQALPRLTIKQILAWADAHHARTGRWPVQWNCDPVVDAPGETWSAINGALNLGNRGLPGGDSLSRVLMRYRGVRRIIYVPKLTIRQILAWADAHLKETGTWPTLDSGPVAGADDVTWGAIDNALIRGGRGLPRGFTLARLLEKYRGMRHMGHLPPLTIPKILAWADAHHRRTGRWPHSDTTEIPEAPGEVWRNVNAALNMGYRGLPGGGSVFQLLVRHGRIPRSNPHVGPVMRRLAQRRGRSNAPKRRQRRAAPARGPQAVRATGRTRA